ncbi:MAG TPA: glycine cleavage system protein GcvH [Actinomycetota bacterium]|nr:glycine cleavage system protein GcvH [Actinomycetota bacterium]
MSQVPEDRSYTAEHEWAKIEGGRIVIGITDHAQEQLGDIVFVDLPDVGDSVTAGESLGEVESTKSVSDVYSPVSGTVTEKNESVEADPELINSDPYGSGWLVAVEASPDALEGMMTAEEYQNLIDQP